MKKIKQNGFTLIELLAVIIILAIILAIAIPGISGIIKNSTKSSFASDAKMVIKAIDYKKLENDSYDPLTLTKENISNDLKISSTNYEQVSLSLVGNAIRIVIVGAGKWDGLTAYGTFKNMKVVNSDDYDVVPPVITLLGTNPMTIDKGTTYTEPGATANDLKDGDLTSSIVTSGSVDTAVIGTYTITYSVMDEMQNNTTVTRTVNVVSPYNVPVLAAGMTPIKWDGSVWVNTTEDDEEWHNYSTTDKKWANAKTADGSFWVWIPRYVYKISSNWHTATAGTIDVKFSMGTDDTRGGAVALDTGTTSNASNNKWTNHPAFTFGTTELNGIWVAKFEASGTTAAVDIKPNVTPIVSQSVGNMFTATRNMETNSRYGWGTSGTGIDTHLMKNIEWGVTVYLSKSTYGKNAEIWINPAGSPLTTGCAGDSVTATLTTGCLRAYNTTNGQQASTTGNVYGIYDLSGGVHEYVAAYMGTGNTNGSSITGANAKYADVYSTVSMVSTDYSNSINKKGDAIYETTSTYQNNNAWYGDASNFPYGNWPWFSRGGQEAGGTSAGAFTLNMTAAASDNRSGFRPVLLVNAGL